MATACENRSLKSFIFFIDKLYQESVMRSTPTQNQYFSAQAQALFFQHQQQMIQRKSSNTVSHPIKEKPSGHDEPQQVCRVVGPSTPQKGNSFASQLKLVPSNAQSEHFRGSSQKKPLNFISVQSGESPQPKPLQIIKKDNSLLDILKRQNTNESSQEISYQSIPGINHQLQDNKYQHLLQENKKLNEFIQRQFKEKQDMKAYIDKLIVEREQKKSQHFKELQQRVESLAQVVEEQAAEIEQWKIKYQEMSEGEPQDDQKRLIEQMEKQIMVVVEENERLNLAKEEMEIQISHLLGKSDVQAQMELLEGRLITHIENERKIKEQLEEKNRQNEQLQRDIDDLQEKLLETELNVQNNQGLSSASRQNRPSIKEIEMRVEHLIQAYEFQIEQKNEKIKELQENRPPLNGPSTKEIKDRVRTVKETINQSIKQFYSLTACR